MTPQHDALNVMLHDFIAANRDAVIARTRGRVGGPPWPSASAHALARGLPIFLTQITEALRLEATESPFPAGAIGAAAARHGAELRGGGFDVSQVVHGYGDICDAITGLALDRKVPITIHEFHTLNRCLDIAIAEAVTEHARITSGTRSADEVERLGHAAHDLRDILNTAFLAFHVLRKGAVGINGSTGAVLGRTLMSLREVVDRALSEVRLTTGKQRRERMSVVAFVDEIAATGMLHSEYRRIQFTVEPVDHSLAIEGDPQLLTSAVMNLLHNGFKNTPAGGHVVLRAHPVDRRLILEVEDECGGFPERKGDLFQVFGDRRGSDRSGLGLGLSIARKTMRAHGGDIHIRNMPGKGCVFVIEVPLASEDMGSRTRMPEAPVCIPGQTDCAKRPTVEGMDDPLPSTGLMIPGERERNTLTHRWPGSMGGAASGSDVGGTPNKLMDEVTIAEHQREGGGAPATRKVA
jgi:signal transduction histidine kinase